MSRARGLSIAIALTLAVVLAALFFGTDLPANLAGGFRAWVETGFSPWLREHPLAAPFVYVALYVAATVAFLPGSVVTLLGGAVFGLVLGTVLVSVASTLGATAAFLIARYLVSDWAERRATGMLARLKHGVEREGWKYVAVTRLIPLFPFNLLNYAFGLTRIRLSHYVLASWLCMLPGTVAVVYTGTVVRDLAQGAQQASRLALKVGVALGAILLASFVLPWVLRRLRSGEALGPEGTSSANEP